MFQPFVPSALKGKRQLTGFRYRNAILDIEVDGYGDKVQSFSIDGKPSDKHTIPYNISGRHKIRIAMNNAFAAKGKINKLPNAFSAATPLFISNNENTRQLEWTKQGSNFSYSYMVNGKLRQVVTKNPALPKPPKDSFRIFQMFAEAEGSQPSFLSAPVEEAPDSTYLNYEAENFAPAAALPYKGFEGSGFVEISKTLNTTLSFRVKITTPGLYRIQFRYANGNGPVNTENKCAIRSLYHNSAFAGSVVFPQRGTNEWSSWGLSNSMLLRLKVGESVLSLQLKDWNENMNEETNQAMVDLLKLTYLGK
jgi:hypothetical protein